MNKYEKKIPLFGDYSFESKAPEDDEVVDSVHMYFYSRKFSKLMDKMFGVVGNPFNQYLSRKLRKDKSGCLAFAMQSVEASTTPNGEVFLNGGEQIDIGEYFDIVSRIDTPTKLRTHLFEFEKNMVAVIERYWVFLYLCCESGITDIPSLLSETERQYQNHWGNAKEVDAFIINEFLVAYGKT